MNKHKRDLALALPNDADAWASGSCRHWQDDAVSRAYDVRGVRSMLGSNARLVLGAAAWLSLLGCPGSTPVESGNDSEDAGSTTTDDGTGSSMTEPASTDTGSTSTTASSADDTSTGEPVACDAEVPRGVACMPPGSASVEWVVRVDGTPVSGQELLEMCAVTDVTDDGVTATVALDCTRFQAEIEVSTTDPHRVPELLPDQLVELHTTAFLEDEPLEARYLTLRADDLVLAAFEVSAFDPPASFDFSPVALAVLATDCDSRPTECVYEQDAALSVDYDGSNALVFPYHDGQVGQMVSYQVIAGNLERIQCFPDDCGYDHVEWMVQGVVIRGPEG